MAIKVLLVVLCLMCMMTTVVAESEKSSQDHSEDDSKQPPAIEKEAAKGPLVPLVCGLKLIITGGFITQEPSLNMLMLLCVTSLT